MTTTGVPPEDKSKAPSDRKSRLNSATWAGIFSIVFALPGAVMIGPLMEEAANWRYEAFGLWVCLPPSFLSGGLIAVLGIVSGRKQKSKHGLWLSVAGLILALVLFLAFAVATWQIMT